ncbi:hypothetical protein V5F53_09995 [Xanthobacter sp. V4C-4]|uniref:hypothetical protein n=1 Tax=Xanthobacter cornucopiae TaxID=3119924 RepID=UPI0037287C25
MKSRSAVRTGGDHDAQDRQSQTVAPRAEARPKRAHREPSSTRGSGSSSGRQTVREAHPPLAASLSRGEIAASRCLYPSRREDCSGTIRNRPARIEPLTRRDDAAPSTRIHHTITDLSAVSNDRINLSAITDNTISGGAVRAFAYTGGSASSGTAGLLQCADELVQAGADDDNVPDLTLSLTVVGTLNDSRVIL